MHYRTGRISPPPWSLSAAEGVVPSPCLLAMAASAGHTRVRAQERPSGARVTKRPLSALPVDQLLVTSQVLLVAALALLQLLAAVQPLLGLDATLQGAVAGETSLGADASPLVAGIAVGLKQLVRTREPARQKHLPARRL